MSKRTYSSRSLTCLLAVLALVVAAGPVFGHAAEPPPSAANLFEGAEREAIKQETVRLSLIQDRHEEAILDLPGVHGMGISLDPATRELVFSVAVEPDALVPMLPSEIEGVRVVVERLEQATIAHGGGGCNPCHANQQALPVQMGNSTGNGLFCSACTLGFKVCKDGAHYYVTNAHCSFDAAGCEGGAPYGSSTYHRGQLDASCNLTTVIGSVSAHATPLCGANNQADSALMASASNKTSWAIRDIGTPSTGWASAVVGDAVQKSGRTTGHTFGTISSVNYTADVGGYCCGTPRFINQIRVNANTPPFILGGDSGSALLDRSSPPRLVGLLFAGPPDGSYGIANYVLTAVSSLTSSYSFDPNCTAKTCQDQCYDYNSQCEEEYCYWNYDQYMCQQGCEEQLQECLAGCP